jgi:acetyl-CoA carboxylase biotin carboxyl carrier protein
MSDHTRDDRSATAPAHSLDDLARFVETVAGHMRAFGLAAVDIEHEGSRIRLRSSDGAAEFPIVHTTAPRSADAQEATSSEQDEGHFIAAPMVGTFYASPAPGEPALVEPGDHVDVGQTIGIIEAMKIMNEIAADRPGIVVEVLVRNAQAVEYGQPLVRLIPDDGA